MGIDPVNRSGVFLDRDGVIVESVVRNGRPFPPAGLADVRILPGVPEALQRLKAAGFFLWVVTNQPDIARGTRSSAEVAEINALLVNSLPLDGIGVCPHDDVDACLCRKPNPGLIVEAAKRYNVALDSSYVIGDRWRDVEAGLRAGCIPIYVDRGYREKRPSPPYVTVTSLSEAADWILSRRLKDA
jgi:D-glycero-D-manno-heptose 1,7-bisphosphate phosphatase